MALGITPHFVDSPFWKAVRAVCPGCGTYSAHRSRKRTVVDHVAGLAGLRVYRCEGCGRLYHGAKWLRLLAPMPVKLGSRRRLGGPDWLHRYRSWRIRDGRHAHRYLLFALVLLTALGGFFLLLWNSHRILVG